MKSVITNYAFTAATREINFASYSSFDSRKLIAIINITRNQLIYAAGEPDYGLSSETGSTITLVFNTTNYADNDRLLVYYDSDIVINGMATAANQSTANGHLATLANGIKYAPSVLFDAAGRMRSSQITTLGDYKTLNEDEALIIETIGTGTGQWIENNYLMSVTAGQYLIRRSKSYHHYFSGKSQQIEETFDNFDTEFGVLKRIGYFSSNAVAPYDSDKDGFWIENTGTTIDLVVSRKGVEKLRKNFTEWDNYLLLQNYDWKNFTVAMFSFLWLGGANLQLAVKYGNAFIIAHTFDYAGTEEGTFILAPNQPMRYEIRSLGSSGTMKYICATVGTEGSIDESGKQKSIDTGVTDINCAVIGTKYVIKAIRKKSTHRNAAVKIVGAQLFVSSSTDRALMTVELNPTLSATLNYTNVANSAVQEANGNGVITVTGAGTKLHSKYITQNTIFDHKVFEKDYLSWLDELIDDTSDQIVICLTPQTATVAANAVIHYKDY